MKRTASTLSAIFLATAAYSNDVQFEQPSGSAVSLTITQSNGSGHRVIGLDSAGVIDTASQYRISGNFDNVRIDQSSTTPTTAAGRVVTTEGLSKINHSLGGSGGHAVILDANVGRLDSKVDLRGSGAASVILNASAVGGSVTHSLQIVGGSSTVNVDQSTTSMLTANLLVTGRNAIANFNLSGDRSSTDVTASLADNAKLNVNQSGFDSTYSLDANLGAGAELTVNQSSNGAMISDRGSLAISVPDGSSLTVTR